jgi:hypothetical protein
MPAWVPGSGHRSSAAGSTALFSMTMPPSRGLRPGKAVFLPSFMKAARQWMAISRRSLHRQNRDEALASLTN